MGVCPLSRGERGPRVHVRIVTFSALVLFVLCVVVFLYTPFEAGLTNIKHIDYSVIIEICDFILLGTIILISIKYKKFLSVFLAILQLIPLIYIEVLIKPAVEEQFRSDIFLCDYLSMIMMFLILDEVCN
jgi:hypothetical protein